MYIQSDCMRSFLRKYSKSNDGNVDLDNLVLNYKSTGNLEDFALICNKTLGIIIYYAKRITNPYITEDDCYSYGLEVLNNAIKIWNKGDKKSSFQTFFNRMVHNYFYTLERTKFYRKLKNNESSLDYLVEELGNNLYDFLPHEKFKVKRVLTLGSTFEPSSIQYKILEILETYNITRKSELAKILGIKSSKLNREIEKLKKNILEI